MPKLKSREDAIAEGAMALFGEKYGETVRTISIVPSGAESRYSYELCGGTHLERTSDVGLFLLVSEGSAAAGVRRIEAVTGRGAYQLVRRRFDALEGIAEGFKASPDEVPAKVEHLQAELAATKRQLADLKKNQAFFTLDANMGGIQEVAGVGVLTLEVPNADVDTLRALGDKFRQKRPDRAVAMLASGAVLIAVVTDDLVKRGLKAADLIAGNRRSRRRTSKHGSGKPGRCIQDCRIFGEDRRSGPSEAKVGRILRPEELRYLRRTGSLSAGRSIRVESPVSIGPPRAWPNRRYTYAWSANAGAEVIIRCDEDTDHRTCRARRPDFHP